MKDATEHLPNSLIVTKNVLDWLDSCERSSNAPALLEERLTWLLVEREHFRPRLLSLDLAIARLESELHPRTDTAPFRDTSLLTDDDDSSDDPNADLRLHPANRHAAQF